MDRRKNIIPYSGELPFIFISYSHEDMEEAIQNVKVDGNIIDSKN